MHYSSGLTIVEACANLHAKMKYYSELLFSCATITYALKRQITTKRKKSSF
jgi:hypothetical protein